MTQVVSFRPDEEEALLIERTRRRLRLGSRAAAVRYLVRAAARKERPLSEEPFMRFRIDLRDKGRPLTSEDIDRELYGG